MNTPSTKRTRHLLIIITLFGIGTAALAAWFYLTVQGSYYRYYFADSLLTTRHGNWAVILIGKEGVRRRVQQYEQQFDQMATMPDSKRSIRADQTMSDELYHVEEITRKHFTGYLFYVYDPNKLRVGITQVEGQGETVSAMVQSSGAIAGVNGGAFLDPEHLGDGAVPSGVVVSDGELIFSSVHDDEPVHIVGIDQDGWLIAGKYPPSAFNELGIREAVTFAPKFIADGKGLIKSRSEGYGLAPRTAIGQLGDGTIVFAVIDGRQLHSIGASLYDLQQLYMELGAVTAANLDGGASSELVISQTIMNKPATRLGERPIPTAWLLLESPESVTFSNPWINLKPEDWQQQ